MSTDREYHTVPFTTQSAGALDHNLIMTQSAGALDHNSIMTQSAGALDHNSITTRSAGALDHNSGGRSSNTEVPLSRDQKHIVDIYFPCG